MRLSLALVVALILAGPLALATEQSLIDAPGDARVWPSQPPKDCPFERSQALTGIVFSGIYSDYHFGDTWYPSWASDGKMYSPWTDGDLYLQPWLEGDKNWMKSSSAGPHATTGNAVMIGDDPLDLWITNTAPPQAAAPEPYQGRYPCGSLVYNGVWYYGTYCLGPAPFIKHEGFTYNWPVLGPMPGFRISRDYGKTWTPSPLTPERPLFPEPKRFMGPVKMGSPHFVDFGRNMEHSPDGKAYLVGMGAEENDPKPRYGNLSWITADQLYLARVAPSPENINNLAKYEFFAGHDAQGKPLWTSDFAQIRPLLDWNNTMGCATVTYDPPLRKFLMCVTDGVLTCAKMNSYVLEADAITGPWRMVAYMKDFGEQGYFLNFPSKFLGSDGLTLWLCYSANFGTFQNNIPLKSNPPGGHYGLCLHRVRLLTPHAKIDRSKRLQDPANIAPQAKVEVSSTHPGANPRGAVDGKVGYAPGDGEWASNGEGKGAWIRLTWDKPRVIDKIWLFDRTNMFDQVTGGRLELSDGDSIALRQPLPNRAAQGVQVAFAPKRVRWVKFVVTDVKPRTRNIGLAEIAVFAAP